MVRITCQRRRELRYGAIRHNPSVGALLGQPPLLEDPHEDREHGQSGEESELDVNEL